MHKLIRQSRTSGVLNLPGRGLKVFPFAIVNPFENLEEDENVQSVVMLERLNLADNEIDEIPEDVGGIGPVLTHFLLRGNSLVQAPRQLAELVGLKLLDMSRNQIREVDEALGTLNSLTELNLSHNSIAELPAGLFSGLSSLLTLNVAKNSLTELPAAIGSLRVCRVLVLSDNQITALPDSTGDLAMLQILSLSRNRIVSLPARFAALGALREFEADSNRIEAWPAGSLPTQHGVLEKLNLGGNPIPRLDEAGLLGLRPSLRELYLTRCKLSEVPEVLGTFSALQVLHLNDNELTDVPEALGYLPKLTSLLIRGNRIRRKRTDFPTTVKLLDYLRSRGPPHPDLPPDQRAGGDPAAEEESGVAAAVDELYKQVFAAKSYRKLVLRGDEEPLLKQLTELPVAMIKDNLSRLDDLALSHLALPLGVPPGLFPAPALKSLRMLEVSKCALGQDSPLPRDLFCGPVTQLPSLRILRIRGNRLTDLAFPAPTGDEHPPFARSIVTVDLSGNALVEVPAFLLRCPGVEEVDLSDNRITGLSEDLPLVRAWSKMASLNLSSNKLTSLGQVPHMQSLVTLNIENNELRRVPPEVSLLPSIRHILLGQNPRTHIKAHVIDRGSQAILRFLRDRVPAGYEAPAWVLASQEAASAPLPPNAPAPGELGGAVAGTAAAGAAADEEQDRSPTGEATPLSPSSALQAQLAKAERELADLELKLEQSHTKSAAVKHAAKKAVQVKRAEKIRLARKLKDQGQG
mmetsp:Transcript_1364/g.4215  ORF Transcript_1364/g.4215 Transcript_1364/m.4215 type:complete len:747 (-) Transcript_1364:110-2350(-)